MLRLTCPYCGERDEPEFVFGGTSRVKRPDPDVDDATWTTYLFVRDNPAGVHVERWLHAYGCGAWLEVSRDTLTHDVWGVQVIDDPGPEVASP